MITFENYKSLKIMVVNANKSTSTQGDWQRIAEFCYDHGFSANGDYYIGCMTYEGFRDYKAALRVELEAK